jgi:hypothetical protein
MIDDSPCTIIRSVRIFLNFFSFNIFIEEVEHMGMVKLLSLKEPMGVEVEVGVEAGVELEPEPEEYFNDNGDK